MLAGFRLNSVAGANVALTVNGATMLTKVAEPWSNLGVMRLYYENVLWMNQGGQTYAITPFESRGTGTTHGLHDGEIEAPMPGKVTAVEVKHGEKVTKGQRLLTLEAMKMEHGMTAPFDGMVAELSAEAGAQVGEGTILARVEPKETK